MKKALAILLAVASLPAAAQFHVWDNPTTPFSTNKNFTTRSIVSWIPVDNVQKACEAESRRRGNGGFGYVLEACSFWDKNSQGQDQCTVITSKKPDMHTIGHEVRHCFQGNFH